MPEFPSGAVTFLLTDVEGSTKRWQADPAAMEAAIEEHDVLVSRVVREYGGLTVKSRGEGDSTFSVFQLPSGALEAAADLQRNLAQGLRVRIAVYSGQAQLRAGDYFGSTVNRGARLRAIAFGGQVLVSAATAELVHDHLPPGLSLRDLGAHTLKDLDRTENVFQLLGPGLDSDFPALRSQNSTPNNLPLQMTTFVGRGQEVAAVDGLLRQSRVVTLTGVGGCGKTRLALEVATAALDRQPDGVWFIELSPLADPQLVAGAVAVAVRVRQDPTRTVTELLEEALGQREVLLLLDNCEHLLDGCAHLVDRLVRACPKLLVLATSREALNVGGEATWRVPSLAPSEGADLFAERAASARPGFLLDERTGPVVDEICRRLDGIPLAIELAAARINVLAPEEIRKRLDDRFRLLTGSSRTAIERHQTLRAAVDWSHSLLSEKERVLLRRLAVFSGGWSLESVEEVGAGGEVASEEVLDLLAGLVEKSLVTAEDSGETVRYRLLDTLRQYGREKLADSGEAEDVQRRHAEHYARAAWTAWNLDHYEPMSGDRRWGAVEMDNLRAAMAWADTGDDALFARLVAGAYTGLAYLFMDLHEAARLLHAALAREPVDETVRAHLEGQAGTTAMLLGDDVEGVRLMNCAVARFERLGEARGASIVIGNLLTVLHNQGQERLEAQLHERRCALLRSSASWPHLVGALRQRAKMMAIEERPEAARALCDEAAEVARAHGLAPESGVPWVLLAEGRPDEELELARADARRANVGYTGGLAALDAVDRIAISEAARGRVRRALRLHGCAKGLRASAGVRTIVVGSLETHHLAAALAAAGPEAALLTAEGSRLSAAQLVDYALSDREDP